ncbi:hypothetical protein GHK48_21615 [Sinorhizobium fredii]|uniref:Transmembrane protein n=1 Tax=Rhizobium fredii TaxID=380 RepID=A0A844AE29_RHIFR|nr:hypothetical protein [Sinorhizobium fredii]MQX10797.1 hypothetical protein [Sinorhizobium fredii]UTY51428.1 hypothetical protein EPK84_15780 [Sinorhizobium fredii]
MNVDGRGVGTPVVGDEPSGCAFACSHRERGQGSRQMTMHMMKVLLSLMAALSFGSLMVLVAVL